MVQHRDRAPARLFRHGSSSISALVFAAGAVALWSTNALVGKSLLATHPVSQVQFLQFAGAALVFALIRFMSREAAPSVAPRAAAAALAVGIIGLVGTMMLQYIAFASMPVIEANLVAYTWPLMVAAAVIAFDNPRRPALLGLAAVLGFVGVALVISGGRENNWFQGDLVGYFAAFGSALCMAFYSVMVGRLATSPDRLLLPSSLVGVALALLWSAGEGVAWPAGMDLALGLYLGAGPMGLGYYFWSRALKLEGSGKVAVVAYLTPIASTLLLTLSGEQLTTTAIAGAVLVIGSCIAVGLERSEAQDYV
ncbi:MULTISPECIES: DMT family transporter [Mesorhizobium]|uniref:EamA domain-containing protein n=2 Tax=Mesorhizobium TaxID=68287 RepID=A0A1A5ID83_RHILI|nr:MULTISPECIES: DMT family transporter [Mesorhizobium]ETA72263.1 DMT(drug/metabolite transporter) superfamily permease [Mesorhizobium japonicum R7A]MBE1709596.1 DMT family transporter [Mesorhizobium japonicum]MBE1714265.1 DMT family transporter [Mesorhizobium japonicum]MUT25001.1 EamA family transporter [Mesorhizobium japonicum]MUT28698.1 EamA family transporter [Mesorhizobium japonicum]